MNPPKENAQLQGASLRAQPQVAEVLAKCLPQPTDSRPVLLCIAGPNGAGKSTLFELLDNGMQFINADEMLKILPPVSNRDHLAQRVTDVVRQHFVDQNASFATETVFSDPKGAKLKMLKKAQKLGYCVVLVYVALPTPSFSSARVMTRVANGGHSVPQEKLERRFHASLENCEAALKTVEYCVVIENTQDLSEGAPFKPMAVTMAGKIQWVEPAIPQYLKDILPQPKPRREKKQK